MLQVLVFKKSVKEKPIDKNLEQRKNVFRFVWDKLESTTKNCLNEFNRKPVDEILEFVKNGHKERKFDRDMDCKRLPTGVIQLGNDSADSNSMFQMLSKSVTDAGFQMVSLQSQTCKTVKKCIELIYKGTVPNSETARHLSMDTLIQRLRSERKTKRHLVILLQDMELFESSMLQDIIEILRDRLSRYSFMLLLGVAGPPETLYSVLTKSTLNCLSLRAFSGPPLGGCLDSLLRALVTAGSSFQLGGSLLQLLTTELAHNRDRSITALLARYKFCLLEHTMHSPLIVDPTPSSDSYSIDLLARHGQYLQRFLKFSRWITVLTQRRSQSLMGNTFLQVLIVHTSTGLGHSKELKSFLSVLRTDAPEDIASLIRQATDVLSDDLENVGPPLADFIIQSNIHANHIICPPPVKSETKTTSSVNLAQNMKEYQARLLLQIRAKNATANQTPFEVFAHWLHSWLANHLPSPREAKLEAIYFDDVAVIRRSLDPQLQTTLMRALSDLELTTKKLDSKRVGQTDIAIVFKLIREIEGRSVNIYDLLRAFTALVGDEDESESPSLVMQCRLQQSIAELQLANFVVRKKGDILAKVFWEGIWN